MKFEKRFERLDEKLKAKRASHQEGVDQIKQLFKQADEELHILACYSAVTIGLMGCALYFFC